MDPQEQQLDADSQAAQIDQTEDQTEQDAFAAGLEDAPTETPAVTQEPEAPAPKYRQITEDEWNEIQTRAAAADTLKATLEKVSGTAFGKIGGIERTLAQLQSSGVGEVSVDDFTKLHEEFPDLAEMLVEGLNGALKKAPRGGATVDLAEIEDKFQTAMTERLDAQELEFRTALVAVRHRDWVDVVKSPEFQQWTSAKPTAYQQKLMGRDSEFVVDALTEFKASRKAQATPSESLRRSRIAAAETPRGSGGSAADTEDPFMAGLRSG